MTTYPRLSRTGFVERIRGEGLGTDLHGRRAHRIRGLQRMAALHSSPAATALADMDVKAADERLDRRRQVLLVLGRGVRVIDGSATVRTRGWQRRVVGVIDHWRHRAATLAAIGRPGLPARPLRVRLRRTFRERRGLTIAGPAGGLELLAQLLVLASQSFPLAFRSRQILFEPRAISLCTRQFVSESFDDLFRIARRRAAHAAVMPRPRFKYKRKLAGSAL